MKILHYSKVRLLTENRNVDDERLPFDLVYVTRDGKILNIKEATVTSVEPSNHRRRIKFKDENGEEISRTIRDCLIMQIDDTRITAN